MNFTLRSISWGSGGALTCNQAQTSRVWNQTEEKGKGFSQILFFGKEDQDRLGDEQARDRTGWHRRLLRHLLEMTETDKQAFWVEGYRSCKKELWIFNRGSLSDYSDDREAAALCNVV